MSIRITQPMSRHGHPSAGSPNPAHPTRSSGDEGTDAVRDAYPASSYARLRELKRRYDPDNVFRANHIICPAKRLADSAGTQMARPEGLGRA
jgi:hypothetical protein